MSAKVPGQKKLKKLHDSEVEKCKVCRGCKQSKPLSAFYLEKRYRRHGNCHRRYITCRLQIDRCVTCINEIRETCLHCQESKPLIEFYNSRRGDVYSRGKKHCNECDWRARRISNRSLSPSSPYRISASEYLDRLKAQGGVCAICFNGPARSLHVDHWHPRGPVRGLLCGRCNPALGFFRDDPALLRKAALYLEQHARALAPSLAKG